MFGLRKEMTILIVLPVEVENTIRIEVTYALLGEGSTVIIRH